MADQSTWKLPSGAWDTHVHIFDSKQGPFHPSRSYTPAEALVPDLLDFTASLSVDKLPANLVIVQPSAYGTDNTVLKAVLGQLRQSESILTRGIAVVDIATVDDRELQSLHDLGVRGLRLNVESSGRAVDVQALKSLIIDAAARIQHLPGWKLQIFGPAYIWDDLYGCILALPVVVILDHFGGLKGSSKLASNTPSGIHQRGFSPIIKLAQQSKVLIKISGLYRASTDAESGYGDLEPIIRKLAGEVPDRLIWASDWPHTGEGSDRLERNLEKIESFRVIDDKRILENLRQWVGSEETWRKMMVTTPAATYE
ncbi:hypothetical protein F4859DRAFT_514394 [Xylaria cf. heliscus]|nr:hypothetical protein F4859DRAFT_514394 [Xylaria cf. heliscus]